MLKICLVSVNTGLFALGAQEPGQMRLEDDRGNRLHKYALLFPCKVDKYPVYFMYRRISHSEDHVPALRPQGRRRRSGG